MAEPARSAAGPGPGQDPGRKPDPRASEWGDVRAAMVTGVRAVRLAVEDIARHPGDAAALEMAGLCLSVLERLGAIAGRCQGDEAELDIEYARGYAQGAADCKAARCRLEVISGGREG